MDHSLITQSPTMTSREIAELTGKRHDNVMRDIRAMLADLVQGGLLNSEAGYIQNWRHPQNGQLYEEFALPKDLTITLVSGYSIPMRHRIVKRWQELEEANVAPAWQIPTTLSGALRLAAEQAQKLEEQQAQIEAAKPAVEFVGRFVEAKSSKCLSDVAKLLGWKPQSFIARLSADAVIFKRGGSWLPFQAHLDAGRFTVKTGESQGHAFQQTRVTPSGVAWLASRYPATVEAKA
jgi:phage antirepressor YoqD-like protein